MVIQFKLQQSRYLPTSYVQPGGSIWTRTLFPEKRLKTQAINLLQSLVTCSLTIRNLFLVCICTATASYPDGHVFAYGLESVHIYVHHLSTYGLWPKHHISSLWYTAWIALSDSLSLSLTCFPIFQSFPSLNPLQFLSRRDWEAMAGVKRKIKSYTSENVSLLTLFCCPIPARGWKFSAATRTRLVCWGHWL